MFKRTFRRRPQPSTPSAAPRFAVQRFIQPTLTVGPVNDPFEREADRVAERVTDRFPSGPLPEPEREEDEGEVRLKATGPPPSSGALNVAPAVEAGIHQADGSGQPLAQPVRGAMENAFGADFHLVRVHADSRSDRLNRSLGARAFTTGTDVFFRGGEYQPDSALGRRLIAHELAHVVQQQGRALPTIQRTKITSSTGEVIPGTEEEDMVAFEGYLADLEGRDDYGSVLNDILTMLNSMEEMTKFDAEVLAICQERSRPRRNKREIGIDEPPLPGPKKQKTHKVILGHGWYNPERTIITNNPLVLYGPPGSTLTRGVAKWLRERGPIEPGNDLLREITNDDFYEIQRQFGGDCPSFDQALWDAARRSDYPKFIEPGTEICRLGLEPQREEEVKEAPNLYQIKRGFQGLENIEEAVGDKGITLHWGSCQQIEDRVRGKDITVILRPDLTLEVYPPTPEELRTEARYQKKLQDRLQPPREASAEQARFVSKGSVEIEDPELRSMLDAEFDNTQKLDDQVVRIDKLVVKYGVSRRQMIAYLASKGKKGTL